MGKEQEINYTAALLSSYCWESRWYDRERNAKSVTVRPITPAQINIRAIHRASPMPNQWPIRLTHSPVVIKGIKINCAIGPIIKVVSGEAADSTLWAKPNTRPCLSKGTTFCSRVCSQASANGNRSIQIKFPITSRIIEGCMVKNIHTVQVMTLICRSVLRGLFHSQKREIISPPAIIAILRHHQIIPHVCTETRESP